MRLAPKLTLSVQPRLRLSPQLLWQFQIIRQPFSTVLHTIREMIHSNPFLIRSPAGDAAEEAIARMAAPSGSLQAYLEVQIDGMALPYTRTELVSELASYLNSQGYLLEWETASRSIQAAYGVSRSEVEDCLQILQSCEPAGVGARSLSECLLLQLDQAPIDDPALEKLIRTVIRSHLEALDLENPGPLAKKLKVTESDLKLAATFIRGHLTPYPASEFTLESAPSVIPSFRLEMVHDQVMVTSLESSALSLSVVQNPPLAAARPDLYAQALQWVQALEERRAKLHDMVQYIAAHQEAFIRQGTVYLQPLTQKDVADAVEMSDSLVSRLVSSKYVETPHGIFSLGILCPRNCFGTTRSRCLKMIESATRQFPNATDQWLCGHLNALGIAISRRSVAYYRKLAGVKSSYQRNS